MKKPAIQECEPVLFCKTSGPLRHHVADMQRAGLDAGMTSGLYTVPGIHSAIEVFYIRVPEDQLIDAMMYLTNLGIVKT